MVIGDATKGEGKLEPSAPADAIKEVGVSADGVVGFEGVGALVIEMGLGVPASDDCDAVKVLAGESVGGEAGVGETSVVSSPSLFISTSFSSLFTTHQLTCAMYQVSDNRYQA